MTCRHSPGDPNCGSYKPQPPAPPTPDASTYSIEQVERVGNHLVLKVLYPNCQKCSYEGIKILVFLNVSELQALRWKKIDPHFRASPDQGRVPVTEAPSPAARFPASPEGWKDAIHYAKSKVVYDTPR